MIVVFFHLPHGASTIVATRLDFQAGRGRAKLRNDIPLGAVPTDGRAGCVWALVWGQRGEERREEGN